MIGDDLRKETVQLARTNMEKEPQIMELQNQEEKRIVRTTELAAAQDKLTRLEKQRDDTSKRLSYSSLILKQSSFPGVAIADMNALIMQVGSLHFEIDGYLMQSIRTILMIVQTCFRDRHSRLALRSVGTRLGHLFGPQRF